MLKNYVKKLYYKNIYLKIILLILIISSVSCGKTLTDPNENNSNTNNTIKIEYPIYLNYGSKGSTINSYEELEGLWRGIVSGKIVYKDQSYTAITGGFKDDANYYESKYQSSNKARTELIKCAAKELNGKNYIAGIYWDNWNEYNMPNDWRLIVIGDDGTEHAWYGGGRDRNNIPNDSTEWTKYDFAFGYLNDYK